MTRTKQKQKGKPSELKLLKKSIKIARRQRFIWEYEAAQRGKEMERLLKIYMGWRRTGTLPAEFCEPTDKVWEMYLQRNIDNKHKRKGHENDSQIERLLARFPDAIEAYEEAIDDGEL